MAEIIRDRAVVAGGNIRRISWGAIIAGVLLALTVQFMLGLLGLGIGLATIDPNGGETPTAATLASSSGIWALAVVLIGIFVGAFTAARLAGSPEKSDSLLHGVVTWATSTLLIVYLLTSGISAVVGSAFGVLGSSIQGISSAAQAIVPNSLGELPAGLRGQAEQLLQRGTQQAQQAAGEVQQQANEAANDARQATGEQDLSTALREIVAGLGEGATPEERQAAVQVISQQAGISQQEAEQRLSQFQAQYDQAVAQAREAADKAANAVSTGAFGGFVAMLLGLVVGAVGGLVGRPKPVIAAARL